ncbi:MAG: macro domain-containing protein [Eggerthellaceae bacterium]|nr:macro domain-containing protein [Eggerthellaceae bacterium]
MNVDAIVVTANENLQITGGVGLAVAKAAGLSPVQQACDAIGFCPTGSAVATPGFALSAKTIVHVVGPVWHDGDQHERDLLRTAYDSALQCAYDEGAQSVALPLISAGTYQTPVEVSFSIAMAAIKDFLDEHDLDIKLALYDRRAVTAALPMLGEIAEFIDDNYVDEHRDERLDQMRRYEAEIEAGFYGSGYGQASMREYDVPMSAPSAPMDYRASSMPMPAEPKPSRKRPGGLLSPLSRISELIEELRERKADEPSPYVDEPTVSGVSTTASMPPVEYSAQEAIATTPDASLGEWLDALDEPFSTTLLALIDARGMTDAEVYKRANMSRQLFSKIRSDEHYRPTKKTALALAIALKLDLDETEDLLQRAGFALSNSSKADVIVEYFILHGKHDIFAINEALYAFDQPLL